jgi:hypothetical protein
VIARAINIFEVGAGRPAASRQVGVLPKLLAILADRGVAVTPAVCEHLTALHLRARQAAHPHEYRVRPVQDELEIAVTGRLEAERYARAQRSNSPSATACTMMRRRALKGHPLFRLCGRKLAAGYPNPDCISFVRTRRPDRSKTSMAEAMSEVQ